MAKQARLLRADEIDVRIGNSNKAKTGFSLMLYKDARCDMDILDELYGPEMWQREHKEVNGTIYCGVSINYGTTEKPYWVTKWDAGSPSETEPEKGAASDSFKRACVNATGVGRELYTAPFIWLDGNPNDSKYTKWKVKEVQYNDKREIIALHIIDAKTNADVFRFGNLTSKAQSKPAPVKQPAPAEAKAIPTPSIAVESKKIKVANDYVNGNVIALNYYETQLKKAKEHWTDQDYIDIYGSLLKNKKIEAIA